MKKPYALTDELNLLDAGTTDLYRDEFDDLVLKIAEAEPVCNVRTVRCFPISAGGRFIALHDNKDEELGVIADIDALDSNSREVLADALDLPGAKADAETEGPPNAKRQKMTDCIYVKELLGNVNEIRFVASESVFNLKEKICELTEVPSARYECHFQMRGDIVESRSTVFENQSVDDASSGCEDLQNCSWIERRSWPAFWCTFNAGKCQATCGMCGL